MNPRTATRDGARERASTAPGKSRRITSMLGLACLAVAGLAQAQGGGAGTCRVRTDGVAGNDGSSWAQAMPLHAALGSVACTEVWVAEGVYKPTTTTGDLVTSFVIRPGVAVYGGFAGGETSRDQRDPAAHRGVLSGDIDGDDTVDAEGITVDGRDIVGENSFHVVWLGNGTTADTVLDGFTLTGGWANGSNVGVEHSGGGGLVCHADGAGQSCSPTLRNLAFRGNLGMTGGGMACMAQNQGTCSARLEQVAFLGNVAYIGGGMLSAGVTGGSSNPIVENATFAGNVGASEGGGFASGDNDGGFSNPLLRNVTFSGNVAGVDGGVGSGGAIYSFTLSGSSTLALVNAILWGDAPAEVSIAGAGMTLAHAIVQGGCPAGATCTGVGTGDPRLGALVFAGITPVFPLGEGSAALDAVGCDDAPALDQRGVARPQGIACDLGSVEVRQARLSVTVEGAGEVGAHATPAPLGASIAACRDGAGSCEAWYRADPDAPFVTLALQPDAGSELLSASGCDGSITGGGSGYATGALAGDCSVSVVFAPAVRTIGGSVTGLVGSGLVLALDGGAESLPISADGAFAFATAIAQGEAFEVTVGTQPGQPAQDCVVYNGSGTVGAADVTNVVVHCGAGLTYSVGGTVSGLAPGGSINLTINGGDELTLAANGAYAFAPRFAPGDGYLVALATQPAGQHCTLAHAEGTVGSADVADVDVDCAVGGAQLQLGVTDGGDYARYGQVRDYFVSLRNTGNGTAANVAVSAELDAAFDEAHVLWTCIGDAPGSACTAEGSGAFADTATLPPGTSLVWIVSVPVRGDSAAAEAGFRAHASGAPDAVDTDTLVIFRDGLDVPYADGAGVPDPMRNQ